MLRWAWDVNDILSAAYSVVSDFLLTTILVDIHQLFLLKLTLLFRSPQRPLSALLLSQKSVMQIKRTVVVNCLLCKHWLACTKRVETKTTVWVTWQTSCIVWEYDIAACSLHQHCFCSHSPQQSGGRSWSLFFFGLVRASTTSCVCQCHKAGQG